MCPCDWDCYCFYFVPSWPEFLQNNVSSFFLLVAALRSWMVLVLQREQFKTTFSTKTSRKLLTSWSTEQDETLTSQTALDFFCRRSTIVHPSHFCKRWPNGGQTLRSNSHWGLLWALTTSTGANTSDRWCTSKYLWTIGFWTLIQKRRQLVDQYLQALKTDEEIIFLKPERSSENL